MAAVPWLIVDPDRASRVQEAQRAGSNTLQNAMSAAAAQNTSDVPNEVLKFAPKKMRRQQSAEDRINQLEIEIRQWEERAGEAETRLRYIEKSIQQIASEHVQGFKKNPAGDR
jgi:predicted  nucleic acid-binding Zn-ribbon protein